MGLWKLILLSLKIGFLSYGGGGTMLMLVHRYFVETGLISPGKFAEIVGTAFTIPGPFGLNITGLAGYVVAGFPGFVIMLLGSMAPSIVLMPPVWHLISGLKSGSGSRLFKSGVRVMGWALTLYAAVNVFAGAFGLNLKPLTLFVAGYMAAWTWLMLKYKLHPGIFILFTLIAFTIGGVVL
jgi:chromate transporter